MHELSVCCLQPAELCPVSICAWRLNRPTEFPSNRLLCDELSGPGFSVPTRFRERPDMNTIIPFSVYVNSLNESAPGNSTPRNFNLEINNGLADGLEPPHRINCHDGKIPAHVCGALFLAAPISTHKTERYQLAHDMLAYHAQQTGLKFIPARDTWRSNAHWLETVHVVLRDVCAV